MVLSAVPALENAAAEFASINWMGQNVEVFEDQWLVSFANRETAEDLMAEYLTAEIGAPAPLRLLGNGSSIGVLQATGTTVEEFASWASSQNGIAHFEPNSVIRVSSFLSDDPVFANDAIVDGLWGLNNDGQRHLQWNGSSFAGTSNSGTLDVDIDAPEAWDFTTGSRDVVIGVIDTGIDYTHPDLYLNIWLNQGEIPAAITSQLTDIDGDSLFTFVDLNDASNAAYVSDFNGNGYIDGGDLLADSDWENSDDLDGNSFEDDLIGWNFVTNTNNPLDDHLHGTHVAGTIGALGDNDVGVAGVNWNVQMIAAKFLSSSGSGTTDDAIDAINYTTALRQAGVNVVATNNSWGGGGSTSLEQAIIDANNEDVLFVAAAGNDGFNIDTNPTYPASYTASNIVSVAAIDANDNLADFSNYGLTSVDLGAPGVNILSTFPTYETAFMAAYGFTTLYETISGTSMATPHVTGAIALLAAANPLATAASLKSAILSSVDVTTALTGKTVSGGRLNAVAALSAMPSADTIVVSTTVDESDGNYSFGDLSLREALLLASGSSADKTRIEFDASLLAGTITLGGLGHLSVASDVVIAGLGADQLTITRTGTGRIFQTSSGVEATIQGLTITGGNGVTQGAGVYNAGTLTLEDVAVTGNQATSSGGGIYSLGSLTIEASSISDNQAASTGGGIRQSGGSLTLLDSVVRENTLTSTTGKGGGLSLYELASLLIDGSSIEENVAGTGGGVYSYFYSESEAVISNSTIADNAANYTYGGGVYIEMIPDENGINFQVVNATISNNTAKYGGGGVYFTGGSTADGLSFTNATIAHNEVTDIPYSGGLGVILADQNSIRLDNTIVAENVAQGVPADISGGSIHASSSYNLIGTGGSGGLTDGVNGNIVLSGSETPGLATLDHYGGATRTHALLTGSDAINAGSNSIAAGLDADQRGFDRTVGQVDIGAFEFAAPILVSSLADLNDGDYSFGELDLREALQLANAFGSDDLISVHPTLAHGTITLGGLGHLSVASDVVIAGLGADQLTITRTGTGRIFQTSSGVEATIQGLTITGGNGVTQGAGVYNAGTLTLEDVAVTGNQATSSGGGIYSLGSLTIEASSISDNQAASTGGGIRQSGGSLTLLDSVVRENTLTSTTGKGGGLSLYELASLLIDGSSIEENVAGTGGGVYSYFYSESEAVISNSTIADNAANYTYGGGVYIEMIPDENGINFQVVNATISNNTAKYGGGGVYFTGGSTADGLSFTNATIAHNEVTDIPYSGGLGVILADQNSIRLDNTIVAENVAQGVPADISGGSIHASSSYNLIGTGGSGGLTDGVNGNIVLSGSETPGLATLDHYGGATRTHALLTGSDAINAGSNSIAAGLDADQRGFDRTVGQVDIGAFEFAAPILVSSLADLNDGDYSFGELDLREALQLANAFAGPDVIEFDSSMAGVVRLASGLEISSNVEILGTGADVVTIDGQRNIEVGSVFTITTDTLEVAIRDLTIKGGTGEFGGGVRGRGDLMLDRVAIIKNFAISGIGGGVYQVGGELLITNSTIANNYSSGAGGGLHLNGTQATILNSTISGNSSLLWGGGITVYQSTVTLVNATIANNVARNAAYEGAGGIFLYPTFVPSSVTLYNTIVAGNLKGTGAYDLYGAFEAASSHNLIGVIDGSSGLSSLTNYYGTSSTPLDAGLTALGDHGGPTQTHALKSTSIAIDAGDNAIAATYGLTADQRGEDRIVDFDNDDITDVIDIGALELAFDEIYS